MGLAIAAVAFVFIALVIGIITISEDIDLSWVSEPKRLKKKNRALTAEVSELKQTIKLLDEKNVKLASELLAYRNKLPWVNVEELDGPKE